MPIVTFRYYEIRNIRNINKADTTNFVYSGATTPAGDFSLKTELSSSYIHNVTVVVVNAVGILSLSRIKFQMT